MCSRHTCMRMQTSLACMHVQGMQQTSLACMHVQGMQVKHCARRAISKHQRITMVTSYVPADRCLPDNSILSPALRMASDQPILFSQWSEYRLQSLASKASALAKVNAIDSRYRFCSPVSMRLYLSHHIGQHMDQHMVPSGSADHVVMCQDWSLSFLHAFEASDTARASSFDDAMMMSSNSCHNHITCSHER